MSAATVFLAAILAPASPEAGPEVQRPAALESGATEAVEPAPAEVSPAEGTPVVEEASPVEETPAEPTPEEPSPDPAPAEAPAEPVADTSETLTVAEGSRGDGPPFYSEEDAAKFRDQQGIEQPAPPREPARWRCLIADPTCGVTFELDATAAYAHRFRQGDVRDSNAKSWASGRAQYDLWVNIPVMVENEGRARYTRMTLGPKGGAVFSDTGDLWGNLGIAARYWFGRGRWAPTLEFTSALTYKIGRRATRNLAGAKPKFQMNRGPVGFTADVGFGLGGFGALVVGGQYDSPLAREDVPEQFRVSAGGMVFVGFRGNILWGGPAAAAVVTHGLTQRYAEAAQ